MAESLLDFEHIAFLAVSIPTAVQSDRERERERESERELAVIFKLGPLEHDLHEALSNYQPFVRVFQPSKLLS